MAKTKQKDHKEDGQTDDLMDWSKKDTCSLYRMAADRTKWNQLVRYVMDIGHQWAVSPWK